MIDYRVEVRNGNLVITKIRGKIASYIYGYEAYKTLMRIVDMPDIRKIKKAIKYRNYDETTLDDMRLLLKNKYNITIKDDKAVFDIKADTGSIFGVYSTLNTRYFVFFCPIKHQFFASKIIMSSYNDVCFR